MSGPLGRGLAFPLRVDEHGAIALNDGVEDVDQAIWLILTTAPGERPMRPEFGCAVHDCVFDGIDPRGLGRVDEAVRVALDRWEPRVEVESIAFERFDGAAGTRLDVHIRYRLKATNDVRNLVYPLYVVPAEGAA